MTSAVDRAGLTLKPQELKKISDILKQHVPGYDVWAFGSRVKGDAKQYSDLDVVVMTTQPLSFELQADIEAAFGESDLPFKVDVVDWANTSEAFRDIIDERKLLLQQGISG